LTPQGTIMTSKREEKTRAAKASRGPFRDAGNQNRGIEITGITIKGAPEDVPATLPRHASCRETTD
jgi:hypothetical protein